jgi:hypothetical protein
MQQAPIPRRMKLTRLLHVYDPRDRVAGQSSRAHSFLLPLRVADGARRQLNPGNPAPVNPAFVWNDNVPSLEAGVSVSFPLGVSLTSAP